MTPPQVEVIVRNLTLVGEGPHYSSRNGGIFYYVDIPGNKVGRYDIKGGKNTFIKVEVSMHVNDDYCTSCCGDSVIILCN